MEIAGSIPESVVASLIEATGVNSPLTIIEGAVREVVANGYPAGKVLEKLQVLSYNGEPA